MGMDSSSISFLHTLGTLGAFRKTDLSKKSVVGSFPGKQDQLTLAKEKKEGLKREWSYPKKAGM